MIAFFIIFLTIIVFAHKKHYFANDDILFYINIFEINFAAMMMRWGNQMQALFVEEERTEVSQNLNPTDLSRMYIV